MERRYLLRDRSTGHFFGELGIKTLSPPEDCDLVLSIKAHSGTVYAHHDVAMIANRYTHFFWADAAALRGARVHFFEPMERA